MPVTNNQRVKNIFISYRVHDTESDTGRLVDALKQVFYEEQIFMDIEKLEPGVDFTQAISKSLESCDVLLAVIGPGWAGPADNNGVTRIKQPKDWVRIEIETALNRNIRVIPVLVKDASVPSEEELPESLHPLLNRQAHEISRTRWKYDTDKLITSLINIGIQPRPKEKPVVEKAASKSGAGRWILFGLAGIGLLTLIGLLMIDSDTPGSKPGTSTGSIAMPVDAGTTDNNPVSLNKTTEDEAPVVNNTEKENANVNGTWHDEAGIYNMLITQNGSRLELRSIGMLGDATGEGSGSVDGNTIKFTIQLYNIGTMTGSATISGNGQHINGQFIELNEAFRWVKN